MPHAGSMHCSATRSRSPNEQPNPAATFRIDPGRNRVSRLTDLLAQAKARDAQMGADLEREFQALSSRLPFGLNLERHRPENTQCIRECIRVQASSHMASSPQRFF